MASSIGDVHLRKIFKHDYRSTDVLKKSYHLETTGLSSDELDNNERCVSSLALSSTERSHDGVTMRHSVLQLLSNKKCQSFSSPNLKQVGYENGLDSVAELPSQQMTNGRAKRTRFSSVEPSDMQPGTDRSSLGGTRSGCYYKDENISQILEGLFLGNIQAAYCEPLLCKLNIVCIVDVSNLLPHQVPGSKKCICPCSCRSSVPHSRAKLRIDCSDGALYSNVKLYSDDVNRFIEAGLSNQRRVLIHCNDGKFRGPIVLVQYLMLRQYMCLKDALYLVKHRWPCLQITPKLINTLCKVEIRKMDIVECCLDCVSVTVPKNGTANWSSNQSMPTTKSPVKAWI